MSHSSNASPSGKPSVFATRQALYELAGKKAQELAGMRSFLQPMREGHYFGPELYQLACRSAGVESMTDRQMMAHFMDEEARVVLMKMPNPHWFWLVVRQAVITSAREEDVQINRQEVLDAITHLRRDMSYKFALSQRLADLPTEGGRREHRIASRTAAGLVLVDLGPFETDTMIDNPVFFDNF